MRFCFVGRSDASRFLLEITIVIEVEKMDHLMLERIVNILREEVVIFPRQHDFLPITDEQTSGKESVGIADARHRQFAGKELDVEKPEATV